MKIYLISLLSPLLLLTTASFAQTIYRVNADVTVTGVNVYNTIQAAHDAAVNGDILIVDPSLSSAGDLACTKTLSIYGRGYYLDKNPDFSNISNTPADSKVNNISIAASNCKISGLSINDLAVNGGVSGTMILRNRMAGLNLYGLPGTAIANTTILQNSISSAIDLRAVTTGSINNVTISNNLIDYGVRFIEDGGAYVLHPDLFSSILINQNTIAYISYGFGVQSFANALFSNNIFYSTANNANSITPSVAVSGTSFSNNVTFGAITISSALGADNIVIASSVGQFNSNAGGSADNNFRVASGSLIKTAGSSGGEVGMFGGDAPYIQFGIPSIPSVTKLFNNGIGNTDTPITATVSGKSNN